MDKIFLIFLIRPTMLLSGCNIQQGINSVVEGDKKHSQQQDNVGTFDIARRLNNQGHLDLSKLNLKEIPDICSLLNSIDLRKVVSLDLSDNNIQQVQGLDCLPNLTQLDLSGNNIDSFVGFPLMENLKKLNIARNKLKDLRGIELLKGIVELQMGENFIEDLEGLQYLKDLQKLGVELNKLKELDLLQYLDDLKEVNAKYNELKKNVDDILEKVPGLEI